MRFNYMIYYLYCKIHYESYNLGYNQYGDVTR